MVERVYGWEPPNEDFISFFTDKDIFRLLTDFFLSTKNLFFA